ncbi:MAG: hypothetical protein R3F49_08060 [Planctomycetota bacterium]
MTSFARTSGLGALALASAGLASAQISIVSNLPGTFMDISATGTPLSLADDGEVDIPTTIGNTLFAAGVARVGSNGGVRFDGTNLDLAFGNTAIPSTGAFAGDQCLLPFWDDVNTQAGLAGEIYWQETAGMLIIQWHNIEFFNSAGLGTARFQVQVPATGTTWARFIYDDIMQGRPNGGASATIGYQGGAISNDAQFSVDTPGAVMDGTVLSLVGTIVPPPPPAVSQGVGMPPNSTGVLDFDNPFVASGLIAGNSATFTNFGISDISLVGTFTAAGDTMTVGSNVAGQGLVSQGGQLAIAGPGEPLDNCSAASGFEITLTTPATEFGAQFVDQINWDYTVEIFLGATSLGTGTFTFGGAFPAPAHFWTSTVGAFDRIRITSNPANGGWGLDEIAFNTGTPTIGTNYCGPAVLNSTGNPGRISASGSNVVANNDLTLEASDLPNSAFGFFLTSTTQGTVPQPGGSQGVLCLGGSIGRYVGAGQIQTTGMTGSFSLLLNLNQTPTPMGFVAVSAGQTWNYQAWHRDAVGGAATSNFTDGLRVTFQ